VTCVLYCEVAALVVAACGGSDDSSSDTVAPSTATSTTAAPVATKGTPTETTHPTKTTAPPYGGIDSFDAIQPAVIQVSSR
jgi:hypothetical protein